MSKTKHPKHERTLVIIKPDGVQRTLVGEIIKRYERVGLKIAAIKMVVPTKAQAQLHYTLDPAWIRKAGEKAIGAYKEKGLAAPESDPVKAGERVLKLLEIYMTSGPVILLVLQGAHSIAIVRKITGGTEPLTSAVGTIRGDFVLDSYQMSDPDGRSVRNLVHASGSVDEAEKEIHHWFKEGEIIQYKLAQEAILYDVNLDGIFE